MIPTMSPTPSESSLLRHTLLWRSANYFDGRMGDIVGINHNASFVEGVLASIALTVARREHELPERSEPRRRMPGGPYSLDLRVNL